MGLFCCLLGDELGGNWIGLMSGFWRGGTIFYSDHSPLSLSLSIYLSLSLQSPLLFISGERFSIYGPLLDHSNLESTAIPIRIVASGTSTITALPITPNLTPESPKQNSCLLPLGNKASVCVPLNLAIRFKFKKLLVFS